jgi:hypothetical protein
MDHEGGDAENPSVVWVLSWRIFLSISIPIFDLGGLLRLRRWLEPIHQSLVGAHTPSTLVYIKQMQHRAFLDYPCHQQFLAVRFPNPMVKIRLEVQLLQMSP